MFKTSPGKGRASGCLLILFLFVGFVVSGSIHAQAQGQDRPMPTTTPSPADSDPFKALQWRLIGPFRGGRSTAVTGVASQPLVYYFGGTGGGVWKTVDGGINWEPITDNVSSPADGRWQDDE